MDGLFSTVLRMSLTAGLVILAVLAARAVLRLDDLLKNAPRPECRAGGALTRGGEPAAAGSPPGYSGW